MASKKIWIISVFLPLILVIGLDQWTKLWAEASSPQWDWGWLRFSLLHNYGFMLGSLKDADSLYTVVMPSTLGAFVLYVFFVIQYFLPIESPGTRIGMSVFCAGFLSNIVDRVLWGYVIDFMIVENSLFKTGVFNIADALQWVGIGLFLTAYIKNGKILYPANERRGRKWIDPKFQGKFCLVLLFVGFSFAAILMALSYTFLDISIAKLMTDSVEAEKFLRNFVMLFTIVSLAFFLSLFIIGIQLSWRIAGPIRGFELYIEDILNGKKRDFKLRTGDEFSQLEGLAAKFHHSFHESLGMDPKALEQTQRAPQFTAQTYEGQNFKLADYLGKKVWLIFYRYATCPLCVMHLKEIKETIEKIQQNGDIVIAVFETRPQDFLKENTGGTSDFLSSLSLPMISDPDRKVYRLYRNRTNILALLNIKTIQRLLQAMRNRFLQGSIDGKLGALPAHFLIDKSGKIETASYSKNMVDHLDIEIVKKFFAV